MSIYWTVYVFVILPVLFAIGETYALMTGRQTLSRYVWTLSKQWPLFPWLVGVLVGVLAGHFWWGGALICYASVK